MYRAVIFLSRPHRFGKSLLLSTLEAIFKGNRELFKGYLINDLEYNWKEHPIIYFDFARIPTESPEELASALQRTLHSIASSYNTSIECPTLQEGLANLVTELTKRGPVVV